MNCPNCQKNLRDSAIFCDQCGRSVSGRSPQSQRGATHVSEPPTPAAPSDLFFGRIIDTKYEILSKLGEGGMGTVYRARRLMIGDEVAIKVLLPKYISDAEMLERFRREARAAAMLHHTNVVTIFDYGEVKGDESYAYIVMELLDGETLRDLLRREGRLSPARALRLLFAACAGVGSAHRRNVLHRDLKPDNILIVPSREEWETEAVKVVDFGIAKLRDLSGDNTLTQFGSVMGTPHYMSPEQCRGDRLDARSDVYSLGVILYEMLAGGPPYVATSATGVIAKHLTEPPPRLPAHLNIPLDLEETISRALSKDPAARQQDAVEFARELQSKFRWILSPEEHVAPSDMHAPLDPRKLHSGSPQAGAVNSSAPSLTETRRETTPVPGNGQAHGLAGPAAGLQQPPAKRSWNPLVLALMLIGGLFVGGLFTFGVLYLTGLIKFDGDSDGPIYASPTPTPTPTPTPRPTPYTSSYNNPNEISTLSSSGEYAVPYPSEIPVSVPAGAVTKVTVTLSQLTHSWPADLRVLLVGPRGHRAVLMAGVGGNNNIAPASPATLTFSDTATTSLSSSLITSGTYRPSRSSDYVFTGSAPPPPYSNTLSVFNNTDPNGTWRLYISDHPDSYRGKLVGGWSLFLTIDPAATPSAPPPAIATPTPFASPRPSPAANMAPRPSSNSSP